jgi:hypothetical protein
MKRITLTVVAVLLAVPVAAHAKAGIEFDKAIEQQKPGDRQTFTAMVMNEPSDPMGGEPKPVVGVHPLVAFRNQRTGSVIRVRATRTDRDGLATGTVAFPDAGPWTADLYVGGKRFTTSDQRFTLTSASAAPASTPRPESSARSDGGSRFPWVWVLSSASIGSAMLVLAMRRRGRWGAA